MKSRPKKVLKCKQSSIKKTPKSAKSDKSIRTDKNDNHNESKTTQKSAETQRQSFEKPARDNEMNILAR